MPVSISYTSLGTLCKDYEFIVSDVDKVAELVAHLCLGQSRHVGNVIQTLAPDYPAPNKKSIEHLLNVLSTTGKSQKHIEKIHGWLFQMMSWIALAKQHKDDSFLQHYPHSQPAMHGLDGIAITLKEDGGIDRIILTEDKCTENPRAIIRTEVWPEFDEIEAGAKNNAISQQIQSLFLNDKAFHKIQNDVVDEKYRQYRIVITRGKSHNATKGRMNLFQGYDSHVTGADVDRRTGATIYIDNLRNWMETFRLKVIDILNNELMKLCTTP